MALDCTVTYSGGQCNKIKQIQTEITFHSVGP